MTKARLQNIALAVAGLAEAVVTLLLALEVMEPELAAGITGVITAGLFAIRTFVTPVEKVAVLLDKPVDLVNRLLKEVKL